MMDEIISREMLQMSIDDFKMSKIIDEDNIINTIKYKFWFVRYVQKVEKPTVSKITERIDKANYITRLVCEEYSLNQAIPQNGLFGRKALINIVLNDVPFNIKKAEILDLVKNLYDSNNDTKLDRRIDKENESLVLASAIIIPLLKPKTNSDEESSMILDLKNQYIQIMTELGYKKDAVDKSIIIAEHIFDTDKKVTSDFDREKRLSLDWQKIYLSFQYEEGNKHLYNEYMKSLNKTDAKSKFMEPCLFIKNVYEQSYSNKTEKMMNKYDLDIDLDLLRGELCAEDTKENYKRCYMKFASKCYREAKCVKSIVSYITDFEELIREMARVEEYESYEPYGAMTKKEMSSFLMSLVEPAYNLSNRVRENLFKKFGDLSKSDAKSLSLYIEKKYANPIMNEKKIGEKVLEYSAFVAAYLEFLNANRTRGVFSKIIHPISFKHEKEKLYSFYKLMVEKKLTLEESESNRLDLMLKNGIIYNVGFDNEKKEIKDYIENIN